MSMWQAADTEASLSLSDDEAAVDLLSPRALVGAPSDEELERHCTPGKLKRYIALHLEKLIEHEEVRHDSLLITLTYNLHA